MKKHILFILSIITSNILLQADTENVPMIKERIIPPNANLGTFRAPLITTVLQSDGPILELGCTDASTPLLHAICSVNQRPLVSADSNKKKLRFFLDLERPWHKFVYVPTYENSKNPQLNKWDEVGNDTHWSIVFIDHEEGDRRVEEIKRLRSNTDIFVVHDTNQYKDCNSLLETFKYSLTYKRYQYETTIASDTIDVTKFFPTDTENAYPMIQDRLLAFKSPGSATGGTHQAPLITVVMNTNGPILELGCGDFSTPILHAICAVNQRTLLSAETDNKWLRFFLDLEAPWHKFVYIPIFENPKKPQPNKWDEVGNDTHWNVVLIDHHPGTRRGVDIERLRSHTDIFVVHDTEKSYKGYNTILPSFKYRVVYRRYKKRTTIVSDTIDVTKFF